MNNIIIISVNDNLRITCTTYIIITTICNSKYINTKVNKILTIYNYISIAILMAFLVILTPLTMIARIIAYKHFWSDVVTAVVMCLFLLGVVSIYVVDYENDEFIKDSYNRLEESQ